MQMPVLNAQTPERERPYSKKALIPGYIKPPIIFQQANNNQEKKIHLYSRTRMTRIRTGDMHTNKNNVRRNHKVDNAPVGFNPLHVINNDRKGVNSDGRVAPAFLS